jgi:sulfur-oxidizing protein SoxY
MKMLKSVFFALACAFAATAQSADGTDSIRWQNLKEQYFKGATIRTDARVKVLAPIAAEDSLNVPIGVKIDGLPDVEEVHVLADYNPIVKAVEFYPKGAMPSLAFRIKLQQTSPIRALAKTKQGTWHMGVAVVEAAGGGCTAPSVGSGDNNWRSTLNQVQSRTFSSAAQSKDAVRVRFGISHPMDTGLAPGIPAFFIEKISVMTEAGREMMRIHAFEPISENPVFSIDLPPEHREAKLKLVGVDNQGNKINARVSQ